MTTELTRALKKHQNEFARVIALNYQAEPFYVFDMSKESPEFKNINFSNVRQFSAFVEEELRNHRVIIGIGRYGENRSIYDHSPLFSGNERRTVHLGIDFWVRPGTQVIVPLDGKVHSFRNNGGKGDYGPTILLEHELDGIKFYTLYGHLSPDSLLYIREGLEFLKGDLLAMVGAPPINGDWPPHLHFQIITDMRGKVGDYEGVCTLQEKARFMQLCPDANLIAQVPHLDLDTEEANRTTGEAAQSNPQQRVYAGVKLPNFPSVSPMRSVSTFIRGWA